MGRKDILVVDNLKDGTKFINLVDLISQIIVIKKTLLRQLLPVMI